MRLIFCYIGQWSLIYKTKIAKPLQKANKLNIKI